MNNLVEVSVIIPSLNEEKTIDICISKVKSVFKQYGIDGEIIVVDNSSDNTPNIAKSLGAKVVTPDRRGYGYAYLYGFKHAKGKYLVLGDADNTYDFLEIPKLLDPLMKREADIVTGSRFKGEIKKGAMPWLHKHIGNPILTKFLNMFFKAGISDAHCGFRAIRRDALEKMNLKCYGMEFASEMIVEAIRNKLRIKEVPITYYPRSSGNSKLNPLSDGWRHLKFMLMQTPEWLYIYPSATFLILGFILLLLGYLKVSISVYVPGTYSMVAGSLLTILAIQIFFFGLYAKLYQGKRYLQESKTLGLVKKYLTLEKGITIGFIILLTGILHVVYLAYIWIEQGYRSLPFRGEYMLGFTLIVIGIQIMFSSFMLSMLLEE